MKRGALTKLVSRIAALASFLALSGCGNAQTSDPNAPLVLERTIPLEGVSGRIDHLAADPAHHRIFIAELGNGSVDIVDLDTGKARRISGLSKPQGIEYFAQRNEIVVACGGDGSVRFFDAGTLAQTASIALGRDADNVRIDSASGEVVVGYGGGALAFIDPNRHVVVRSIALPAHPEAFRIDPGTGRIYVNLPDAHAIAVADERSGPPLAQWHAMHLMNFPMALDREAKVLAIGYRTPARLVLIDEENGKVRQDVATCGDADDIFFDRMRQRIYVICGSGAVDVVQKIESDYTPMARLSTRGGARTGLFVPELDRLVVAGLGQVFGSGAGLMVFRPMR